ncbi:MAG: GT-D fold domain-containing glycosyltransferase [Bacteroidales bacterium]|nr:GT-D fold domain-containing glycosyltransferase [Bacteroidales bacterium]
MKEVLENGKTFIRFGDGEIFLLNYGNMGYEDSTPYIRSSFKRIINNYRDNSPYVLGINEGPLTKSNKDLKSNNLLRCWLPLKAYYYLYFPKQVSYIDSSIFYYQETIPKFVEEYLLDKQVVVVTKKETIEKLVSNKNIPFKDIVYIETPAVKASLMSKQIMEDILTSVESSKKKSVVLLACGPFSKILAYDLALKNIQSIDIGVGVEFMYTGTDKSEMVKPAASYR